MTTATETQPTKHTNDCVRQRFKFGARSKAGDVCSCGGITVATKTNETESTTTLSNFRVEYRPPRYEDGRVLYDGYCAILANDAALDGAEVRVFNVPDVDEGQLAAAMFACDAMNAHARLVEALQDARQVFMPQKGGPSIRKDTLLMKIDAALATTTSK